MVFNIPGTENWGAGFAKMGGTIGTFLYWTVAFILLFAIVGGVIWWWSNKKKYNQPIKLIYLAEDKATIKREIGGLKGGMITNKQGIKDFAIKFKGKMKTLKLGYVPDRNLTNRKGELVFAVIGDGTILQQIEETEFVDHKVKLTEEQIDKAVEYYLDYVNKEPQYKDISQDDRIKLVDQAVNKYIEENTKTAKSLIIKPIPTNVKTTTINNIHDVRNILDKTRLTTQAMIVGAVIIMILGHLVWTYIVLKNIKG